MAALEMLPAVAARRREGRSSPPDAPDTVYFGPFALSVTARGLWREGVPVALNARAFDVLSVLVEAAGQVVSREALLQRVWGGTAVEASNLTVTVCQLRRALSAGGGAGAGLIATVSGRGYQLAATVRAGMEQPIALWLETWRQLGPGVRFPMLAEALPPTLIAVLSRVPGVVLGERAGAWRLRGSFQEFEGAVRVSAQIFDGTGEVVWAAQTTFAAPTPFALHDAIAAWIEAAVAQLLN